MMIDFVEVEKSVRALKQQVDTGKLDRSVFEAKLLDMIDVAGDGYYWMFGHVTEQWYRHDGRAWIQDNPGELLAPISEKKHGREHHPNLSPPPPVDVGWFFISLVLLAVIFGIVYASALVTF